MSLVKMRSYWIRVGPNPVTDVFIRKENRDTHREGRTTGRNWSDAALS